MINNPPKPTSKMEACDGANEEQPRREKISKQNEPEKVKHVQGAREHAKRCMRVRHQGQILTRLIENDKTFLSVGT